MPSQVIQIYMNVKANKYCQKMKLSISPKNNDQQKCIENIIEQHKQNIMLNRTHIVIQGGSVNPKPILIYLGTMKCPDEKNKL